MVSELGASVGDALLAPHRSYLGPVGPLLGRGVVKGMAHITGGGITENLPRILPDGCAAEVRVDSWTPPSIFQVIQRYGAITADEMLRVFNMGVGMIVSCAAADSEQVMAALQAGRGEPWQLGRVVAAGATGGSGGEAARVRYVAS